MLQFDTVIGYFEPKRTDDLRDEARPFVGQLLAFEALWLIEQGEGPYAGQWAMQPVDKNGDVLPMGWVPEEDIRYIPLIS